MSEGTKPAPKFKVGDRVIHKNDSPAIVTKVVEAHFLLWTSTWTSVIYHIRPDRGQIDVTTSEADLRPEDTPSPPATF